MASIESTSTIDISSLSLAEYRHLLMEKMDNVNRIIDYVNPSGISGKIIRNASPQERKEHLSGIKQVAFLSNLTDFDVWFFDKTKIAYFVVASKIGLVVKKSRVKKCICGYIDLFSSEEELIHSNRSRIRLMGNISDPMCCRKHSMYRIIKSFEKSLIKTKPEQYYFETRADAEEAFRISNRKMFFPEKI